MVPIPTHSGLWPIFVQPHIFSRPPEAKRITFLRSTFFALDPPASRKAASVMAVNGSHTHLFADYGNINEYTLCPEKKRGSTFVIITLKKHTRFL